MEAISTQHLIWALASTSLAGFMFLLGWVFKIKAEHIRDKEAVQKEVHGNRLALQKKTDFEWIEKNVVSRLDSMTQEFIRFRSTLVSELGDGATPGNLPRNLNKLYKDIEEIKEYLIGTPQREGLVSIVHNLECRNNGCVKSK
jgi:hypothetical protein